MRGVYFLANDRMFEQCIAFLTSFRLNNPSIPLVLIPFDHYIQRLTSLQPKYRFSIWEREEVLTTCDELCCLVKGRSHGHFRKLACWEGPFDEFIYVDSDTVVLETLDVVFGFLSQWDFLASHSNIASIRKWVWKDSATRENSLTREQIAYSANTGFMCSKRNAVRVPDAFAAWHRIGSLAKDLNTELIDQPFLNYFIVTSGLRFSSLYSIFLMNRAVDIPLERWGGRELGPTLNGRFLSAMFPRTLLVHWAGEWKLAHAENREIRNSNLWKYYRYLDP